MALKFYSHLDSSAVGMSVKSRGLVPSRDRALRHQRGSDMNYLFLWMNVKHNDKYFYCKSLTNIFFAVMWTRGWPWSQIMNAVASWQALFRIKDLRHFTCAVHVATSQNVPHYYPFVKGIHGSPVDLFREGRVMWLWYLLFYRMNKLLNTVKLYLFITFHIYCYRILKTWSNPNLNKSFTTVT